MGKTTLAGVLSNRMGIPHFSAGALLAKVKDLTSKEVMRPQANQDRLLRALEGTRLEHPVFILDGHFCLWIERKRVVDLPEEVFRRIGPTSVVVAIDEPGTIVKRLSERDRVAYSESAISELQGREVHHARRICSTLGVPLMIANPRNAALIEEFFRKSNASPKQ